MSKRMRLFHHTLDSLHESVRLATYDTWKIDLDPKLLVAMGYVNVGTKTPRIQCVFCGYSTSVVQNTSGGIAKLDELYSAHTDLCPISSNHPTGNVPLLEEPVKSSNISKDHEFESLYYFLEKYSQMKWETYYPFNKSQDSAIEELLSELRNRRKTFAGWPINHVVKRKTLAEAGFYYTGLSDFVKCHSCEGGLFNWREDDDPFRDHFYYYPHCQFIKDAKIAVETTYTKRIHGKYPSLTENEKELLMTHPIAKLLQNVMRPSIDIKENLSTCFHYNGAMPVTVGMAIAHIQGKGDLYARHYNQLLRTNHREEKVWRKLLRQVTTCTDVSKQLRRRRKRYLDRYENINISSDESESDEEDSTSTSDISYEIELEPEDFEKDVDYSKCIKRGNGESVVNAENAIKPASQKEASSNVYTDMIHELENIRITQENENISDSENSDARRITSDERLPLSSRRSGRTCTQRNVSARSTPEELENLNAGNSDVQEDDSSLEKELSGDEVQIAEELSLSNLTSSFQSKFDQKFPN